MQINVEVATNGYQILLAGSIVLPLIKPSVSSLSFREYLDKQCNYERCALLCFDTFGQDIHNMVDDMWDLDNIVQFRTVELHYAEKAGHIDYFLCKIMIAILGCKNEKVRARSEVPALQKYVWFYW